MAFTNKQGLSISFECSELIEELKKDILEFGPDETLTVWCRQCEDLTFYVNYDFIEKEKVKPSEIQENEHLETMTAKELLELLIQQNEIL